jgi:hypothetical protein
MTGSDCSKTAMFATGLLSTSDWTGASLIGLAYDVITDMRQSWLTNMLQPPRLYSTFNYDYIDSQATPCGPVRSAEYYKDNWGSGAVNFFPSQTGADKLEPGKGYLIFFSTAKGNTMF